MGAAQGQPSVALSGWGRYPVAHCTIRAPGSDDALGHAIAGGPAIARGAGRAYGDSALQPAGTVLTEGLGATIDLDGATGILTADSGVTLAAVLVHAVPRGWFLPVTPGTKFVSLGGAIAADVHGKNHHGAGSFGEHVLWLELAGADGRILRCSRSEEPALFGATVGGMGLTGVVRRCAVQMIPIETAWVRQETVTAPDLDAAFAAFEASEGWTYSVAWIDALAGGASLGRALLHRGEHARRDELPEPARAAPLALPRRRVMTIPFDAPGGLLNGWTARLFNAAYWARNSRAPGPRIVDYESFFYPLDGVLHWNRLYGRRGFLQYQCVLPLVESRAGLRRLLELLHEARLGAFLAVLKLMGEGRGTGLSFPMRGYTLALDFPYSPSLLALLDRLDAVVADHGGRVYLAKDARMRAETFRRGYPHAEAFDAVRRQHGAAGVFRSLQSERLGLA